MLKKRRNMWGKLIGVHRKQEILKSHQHQESRDHLCSVLSLTMDSSRDKDKTEHCLLEQVVY